MKGAGLPKPPRHTCAACGAKIVQYRHRLNKGLASALIRAWEVNGPRPFNPAYLGLTHSQMSNWQKLRYWFFIGKGPEDQGGTWRITVTGIEFLSGLPTFDGIWTYRGNPVPHGERPIKWTYLKELVPGYEHRQSYAKNEKLPLVEGQQNLF